MDGKSLLPTFRKPEKRFRDAFLIERGKLTQDKEDDFHGDSPLAKDELSMHERLSVECAKPRYQAPCSLGQKWVCRRREHGSLKISRCKNRRGERRRSDICHCNLGEVFGWKNVEVQKKETHQKSLQRKNLKLKLQKLSPKFSKSFPTWLNRATRSASGSHKSMLEKVALDEISEVDYLVDDVAEEIRDLHGLSNSTNEGCVSSNSSSECYHSVVENTSTWGHL